MRELTVNEVELVDGARKYSETEQRCHADILDGAEWGAGIGATLGGAIGRVPGIFLGGALGYLIGGAYGIKTSMACQSMAK